MGHRPISALFLLALGGLLLSACSLLVAEDAVCGNGVVEWPEECDRDDNGGQDCDSFGYGGGHLICTPFCRLETWNCHNDDCGDGECDHDENQATCSEDCVEASYCGDGKCDASEIGGCEDCNGVVCGDGYCDRLTEKDVCSLDCASYTFCGDQLCQAWEIEMGGCGEDCFEEGCNYDSVCEPDRREPENQCGDCSGTPTCGNGSCDMPDEGEQNCPFDCVVQACGDNQVQSGEQCDHYALYGACHDLDSRAGMKYEGGELRCNEDCFFDTWECLPKDLGAFCVIDEDCWHGEENNAICLSGGGGAGMCTLPCDTENAACGPSGATCHDVNGNSDFYCLWPCSETGEMRCDPRLVCLQVPMASANWFCLPSDQ